MLLMPLCVRPRRIMYISFLMFEGSFKLHKRARIDLSRHSRSHEHFSKDVVRGLVA